MSEPLPPEPLPGPHNLAVQRQGLPGCGIAAYALLLFVIFVGGVTGVVTAYSSLIESSEGASPYNLTYGGNVHPSSLGPLRAVGLLGREQVPELIHVENYLATEVCAVVGDDLVRLDAKGPRSMPIPSLRSVTEEPEGVRATGTMEIFCPFGEGQGADRLARILRAEAGLAE